MALNIGVEFLSLSSDDRITLMKGLFLRRFELRDVLTKDQLTTAIEADIGAIREKFASFDPEEFLGMDIPTFYSSLLAGMTLNERDNPDNPDDPLVERGQFADAFESRLSENMEFLIEMTPMSTRGFFDRLKSKPDKTRTVYLSPEELMEAEKDGKRTIVDDSNNHWRKSHG